MKNTLRSKTLTASLDASPSTLFAHIAEPTALPQWHTAFCRSLEKVADGFIAESPRGRVSVRFFRNDRAGILDIEMRQINDVELLTAIRVLPNGTGSEIILTLVQPTGFLDAAFHEQVRWAESALRNLRKIPAVDPAAATIAATQVSQASAETAPVLDSTNSTVTPETVSAVTTPKLFVGNLPFDWSEELLRTHWADLGTIVNVTIARFRNHGRSRGFGFVEMATEAEAQNAIAKLHESMAGGRKIIVRLAHTKDSRPEKAPQAAKALAQETQSKPAQPRSAPPRRNREAPPPALARRSRSTLPRSPRPSQDIQNKSGYEYFARRAPGTPAPAASETAAQSTPPPRGPAREASPYFDDSEEVQRPLRRRGR